MYVNGESIDVQKGLVETPKDHKYEALILDTIPQNSNPLHENEDVLIGVSLDEQMPRFPGCEDIEGSSSEKEKCAKMKMVSYVYSNMRYPKEARDSRIEGTAVVQFTVDEEGEIGGIKLLRDPGCGLGEEACRIVESMNELPEPWTPGMQSGKLVKVLYTLPVKFKLVTTSAINFKKD